MLHKGLLSGVLCPFLSCEICSALFDAIIGKASALPVLEQPVKRLSLAGVHRRGKREPQKGDESHRSPAC